MDCLRLPLSLTTGSIFFGIVSTNNSTKVYGNSKPLLDMSLETRMRRLMKKRE
jgi:hypothetical protein